MDFYLLEIIWHYIRRMISALRFFVIPTVTINSTWRAKRVVKAVLIVCAKFFVLRDKSMTWHAVVWFTKFLFPVIPEVWVLSFLPRTLSADLSLILVCRAHYLTAGDQADRVFVILKIRFSSPTVAKHDLFVITCGLLMPFVSLYHSKFHGHG